jgi:glutathione S-transferase
LLHVEAWKTNTKVQDSWQHEVLGPMAATLSYFNGRGHGERVRYALAAAGIPFSETLLTKRGDMDSVRPKCLFGQVPLLEIGGVPAIQSWATVRHIAAISGMVPKDAALAWRADAVAEQVRDLFVAGNLVSFGWGEREADAAKVAAAAAAHLPKFEAILGEGAPFVCGAEANWADFQLLYGLNYVRYGAACHRAKLRAQQLTHNPRFLQIEEVLPGSLGAYPRLAKLRDALNTLPRMAAFLAGQAKPLVNEQYIYEVRTAQLPSEAP